MSAQGPFRLGRARSPSRRTVSWSRRARRHTVRLWDAATGAPRQPLKGHSDWVSSVAFSPDGKLVASGSDDKTVRLWDAATGAPHGEPLEGHSDWVSSVAFSPDGKLVASGSSDGTVRLWNAATGAPRGETLKGHSSRVHSVAFSPDGKLVASGSGDQTVRLWDAVTGAPRGRRSRAIRTRSTRSPSHWTASWSRRARVTRRSGSGTR